MTNINDTQNIKTILFDFIDKNDPFYAEFLATLEMTEFPLTVYYIAENNKMIDFFKNISNFQKIENMDEILDGNSNKKIWGEIVSLKWEHQSDYNEYNIIINVDEEDKKTISLLKKYLISLWENEGKELDDSSIIKNAFNKLIEWVKEYLTNIKNKRFYDIYLLTEDNTAYTFDYVFGEDITNSDTWLYQNKITDKNKKEVLHFVKGILEILEEKELEKKYIINPENIEMDFFNNYLWDSSKVIIKI